MSFFPGDSKLFAPLFSDPRMEGLFSDEAYVRSLLEVEAALARVLGELGMIPADAAERIASLTSSFEPDLGRLRESIERDGFPVAGLVNQVRERVGDEAAPFVHRGATTQDVVDTGLILRLRDALELLEADIEDVVAALAALAERHRDTLMAGRTHSQQALPITFGLKAAIWLSPFARHRERLAELRPRLLRLQFGGAAGTLASLGGDGLAVRDALAAELGLTAAAVPWHTQRDTLAELAGWLSGVTGSLGKFAQDVLLMSQNEVGELAESDESGAGGSSTMPQKRNPVRCELMIAAARQNAALLGSMHQALLQEHERGTHGWQLEWLTLPQMVALTSGALRNGIRVAEHLSVDPERMRQNVEASNGLMMSEAASLLLGRHLPPDEARRIVRDAVAVSTRTGRHLIDVLGETSDLPVDWSTIRDEESWLGSARRMTDDILGQLRTR